ncbi:MAG: hypothetical protein JKX68_01560 [Flavobacteriales bacterium]|nr:hypothetical protein [Flavobacteriales bacterium]
MKISKKKTIVISCNDSYFVNSFIENPNIILCTFFGNIIQSSSNLDLDYFKYCVYEEGASEILVVGHYNCDNNESMQLHQLEKSNWTSAKKQLNILRKKSDKERIPTTPKKQKVWIDLIDQILKISRMSLFQNNRCKFEINIKGIIIYEVKNYQVQEVNLIN